LRKEGPRQLSFVFADSPSGGGRDERSDASELRSFLLHKAKRKKTSGPNASAADTRRLLEDAATEANLARALLNVVRNKGAGSGWTDGRSGRGESPGYHRPFAP